MVKLCEQLFEIGLAEHKRRQAEVNSFLSGRTKLVTDYQKKASQVLAEFEQQHQEVSWAIHYVSKGLLDVYIDNSSLTLLIVDQHFLCS